MMHALKKGFGKPMDPRFAGSLIGFSAYRCRSYRSSSAMNMPCGHRAQRESGGGDVRQIETETAWANGYIDAAFRAACWVQCRMLGAGGAPHAAKSTIPA